MNNFPCTGGTGTAAGSNLVYLNKIYFDETQGSCPILYALTTAPETFTQQLTFGQVRDNCGCSNGCGCGGNCGCGNCCGCCDFTLTENTTFSITSSHITVTAFSLSEDAVFTAADVTVDGFPATDLTFAGGQYIADLSGIMSDITDCPCQQRPIRCTCMPDDRCSQDCENGGHFFLAQVPGPWVLNTTVILEGTASNGSRTCSFRLCLRTIPGAEGGITIPGSDNFAMYCVNIPCQTGGTTPYLVFDFSGCASLLNPVLTVAAGETGITLTLNTTVVITPEINLRVIKQALFSLNASELYQPCDDVGQCDTCQQQCCGCTDQAAGTDSRCTSRSAAIPGAFQCCDTNGYAF